MRILKIDCKKITILARLHWNPYCLWCHVFPLDYMHLVCLGITKKLLHLWTCGYHMSKLSRQKIAQLSNKLIAISKWVPKEFVRKPRSLDDLSRWRATEFRLFLLYVGPIAFCSEITYILMCCTVLFAYYVTIDCLHNNKYSRDLLIHFVKVCKQLYGEDSIIYNVHNLIHLNENVIKYDHSISLHFLLKTICRQ